ncbi:MULTISPECIES: TetR/AcrR family transcriptional regulator [Pseudomonas]|jgi:AcrR family transcriptional regulator|uniref:TetR/AcrR family transcriptional regulator n=1 Tax=Pseudomonas aphyarum TaxID=2942629 RepID=A0ABT5PH10_9PSED|nr:MULTISPECIES: TetR/AcrR family transcriptional regulator [Pseudomonas]MBX8471774.1 TetR/AcrR family transcriptional regulator [Pseudomonas sp. RIT778]MDD0967853.1 TetR/AcrR family transcriptional regulator [Pseudomonas aphyarum]MDD1123164.1 TetR/AcrR family transcriptional regulator [Pseudomonas aphyarum]MDD1139792.1 TetR/AcrR family transcriptional regulator [Pseudomonas aphyarum]UVM29861.1 TetR/AcrR family transcriptional regulator [Pseudomonas sp. B21-021]
MTQAGRTKNKAQDSGWRGSVDVWLDAAYEALKESGVDAVRVMPLAKRLNLSRTSFYWFYEDREQLLAALLARWRDKNTGGLVGQCERYAESVSEAILNVFECWLNPALFDSQFEFAVRSWALQSDEVAGQIALADDARINALAAMFRRFGYEPGAADARARTIYLTQIGYISMKTTEDVIVRFRRIPQYVTVFTGKSPKRRELDRFFGQFGYAETEPGVFVPLVETFEEALPDDQ